MQKVSKITRAILEERSVKDKIKYDNIAYGDCDLLDTIFEHAKMTVKISHPLNHHQAVLNALDRESKRPDAIFVKEYFRSFKGLARMFTLKLTNGDN